MHDAGAIFCGDIITRNNSESLISNFHKPVISIREYVVRMTFCKFFNIICAHVIKFLYRLHPLHELRIMHPYKFRAFPSAHNLIWKHLVALLVRLHIGLGAFCLEVSAHKHFCQHHCNLFAGVRIESAQRNIIKRRPYTQCSVRRESPGSCGPSHETRLAPSFHLRFGVNYREQSGGSSVFNVAIASGLVKFMRT